MFETFLAKHGAPENCVVLVACSGGADSVYLLRTAVREMGAKRVVAAHFNHRLRPDSAADARFVKDLCAKLGVRFIG